MITDLMRWMAAILVSALLSLSCATSSQQPAPSDGFRNLQVLPQNITRDELITTMRRFTQALGVKCDYCHVANPPGVEPELDFPSDAMPEKTIARLMIRMVNRANNETIARVPEATARVTCWTCHRGETRPATPPPLPERVLGPRP